MLIILIFFFANPGFRSAFSLSERWFAQRNEGSFLLAGAPADTTFCMPLFETASSIFLNLGMTPKSMLISLHLGVFALVFLLGSISGGYWAGILALTWVCAGENEIAACGTEQLFYTLFLLLILCFMATKRREEPLKNALFSGLCIGSSMLVRSPLFLFPFFAVLADWFRKKERGTFLRRSLVFIAASYVLLLPWGFLNYSVEGKVDFFDSKRASCNLISTAMGTIYTMEGNPRQLAGIGVNESAFGFFLRKVRENPGFYALTTIRRLWYIFLFQPLLFGLFVVALLSERKSDREPGFILPVYFVLIHALLSIEERYLYPMAYLLPPLITGALMRRWGAQARRSCDLERKAATAIFALLFTIVLGVEALVLSYPRRAARNAADDAVFSRLSGKFPRDRFLYERKCRELWGKGDDAGFYSCIAGYDKKFGDNIKKYFLLAMSARTAQEIPAPLCDNTREYQNCLIIKMLRELELGDQPAFEASYKDALAAYQATSSYLRGEPYKKDKEIALFLKQDNSYFLNLYLYRILILWPPERMEKILARLKTKTDLTEQLKTLSRDLETARHLGKAGDLGLRKRLIAFW